MSSNSGIVVDGRRVIERHTDAVKPITRQELADWAIGYVYGGNIDLVIEKAKAVKREREAREAAQYGEA